MIAALLPLVFEAADVAADPAVSRLLVAQLNLIQGKEVAEAAGSGVTEVDYDRLLLAIASTPSIPLIPGNDLPGVLGYRDIADTGKYRHAVVVATGIKPNFTLAESAGLHCGSGRVRGIHVADTLQTVTDPRI